MNVPFEGRRLAFWTAGSGIPTILIHGSLATSSTWRRAAANLDGAGLQLIAPDLPGWGESEAEPENCPDLIEYETRAIEALAQEQREPVVLVAHSYGCIVALLAVLRGRIALRSLVLFEPTLVALLRQTGDRGAYDEMERFVADYRRAFAAGDKYAARGVIDLWGGAGSFEAMPEAARNAIAAWVPRNLRHWQPAFERRSMFEQLDSIKVPTTLVQSERAHPTARLIVRRMHERIAGSRVVEIAGANHFLILTHPADTARVIRESLST
ncbi:MAG TPA: alpha/beta hydrolase [Burkholderiales bacterium]|nr:alpha/beta hydrolase [Burkholderiales bacterium]